MICFNIAQHIEKILPGIQVPSSCNAQAAHAKVIIQLLDFISIDATL